ncbi:MAG TPA: hypothetical protein VGM76_07710 [Lacipirellulaceae bacterium]|jgi:hypothetical protein
MDRSRIRGRWIWWSAACYAILVVGVVWSLFAARRWALADLATPQSTAEWEAWRADVRAEQDQPSPVHRAVPKSAEPPALVLMRDYFRVSLTGAILFSSVLFWICSWLLHGMLTAPAANADRR